MPKIIFCVVVILLCCLSVVARSASKSSESSESNSNSKSSESKEQQQELAKQQELANDLLTGQKLGLQCFFGSISTDERLGGTNSYEIVECPDTLECGQSYCQSEHWRTTVKACVNAAADDFCQRQRKLCTDGGGSDYRCNKCTGNLCNGSGGRPMGWAQLLLVCMCIVLVVWAGQAFE